MKTYSIKDAAGVFAENKDIAGEIRETFVLPTLRVGDEIALDFAGVEGATQSFVHAMVSKAIREFGSEALDHIVFRHCNDSVRGIIEIVTDYMQESI